MAWESTGTVTVTNGSPIVTGAGAGLHWINAGILPADALVIRGEAPMEIQSVDSASQITLRRPWLGATAAGVAYAIQPTRGFGAQLATSFRAIEAAQRSYVDTVFQGRFQPGTSAQPGVRFIGDDDTGLTNPAPNALGVATGGVERVRVEAQVVMIGRGDARQALVLNGTAATGEGAFVAFQRGGAATFFLGHAGAALGGQERDDQLYWTYGTQSHRFYSNGVERARIDGATGNFGFGTTGPQGRLHVVSPMAQQIINFADTGSTYYDAKAHFFRGRLDQGTPSRMTIDENGNLLVGATSGSNHVISKGGTPGAAILDVTPAATFSIGDAFGINGAAAVMKVTGIQSTGRSISAAGTGNFAGSDYAEYIVKALGCGIVLKGQVVGRDVDGRLTDRWSRSRLFRLKSTDPSLVGGDTWDRDVGPAPEAPIAPVDPLNGVPLPDAPGVFVEPEPAAFVEPSPDVPPLPPAFDHAPPPIGASNEDIALWAERDSAARMERYRYLAAMQPVEAWQARYDARAAEVQAWTRRRDEHAARVAAHEALTTAAETYAAEKASYDADSQAYDVALADWQARHDAARACVDRIAYAGQCPVRFTGAFNVGDYLIAVEGPDDTIAVEAVSAADINGMQRSRAIGRVACAMTGDMAAKVAAIWGAPAEGMPWVDVVIS
ncbi:MAG: hypothetical protein FJ335_04275 [Sphingomonadales bacterium]|nr:hypothetical protein [Sphingomonadales bacterium]